MRAIIVDANVLIAAQLARDQHHRVGREIANGIDQGALPDGVIPVDALVEVLNFLRTRGGRGMAVETLDAINESSGPTLAPRTRDDFEAARPLFRRYETLSFTDAVIASFARRTGRRYLYSFDSDFDAVEGVTRLDAPVDPFR